MSDFVVRPSIKLIKLTYWLAVLLAAAVFSYSFVESAPGYAIWLAILPGILFVCAMLTHLSRLFTRLTVAVERLRYETGIFGKTTRTMELRKVQDVRVDQTLGQRMLNLGNLSIETAGETSRMTIANIDAPNEVAERILAAAHQPSKGQSE